MVRRLAWAAMMSSAPSSLDARQVVAALQGTSTISAALRGSRLARPYDAERKQSLYSRRVTMRRSLALIVLGWPQAVMMAYNRLIGRRVTDS